MPAAPEIRDAVRQIGVAEVFGKLEAQHPPQADGHIRIAGEIEIDLEGEGDGPQPGVRHGEGGGIHGLVHVPQGSYGVGQDDFFPQALDEAPHAGGEGGTGDPPVGELRRDIPVPHDGPGDELGEEGDEGAEADVIPLGLHLAPVHVDGIAHGLEGIEGDADGQPQPQGSQKGQEGDQPQVLREKIIVFEEEQQGQIQHDAEGEHGLALLPPPDDQQAGSIVQGDGEYHQKDVYRLSPAVEHQVHDEEPEVAPPGGDQEIHRQRHREIDEQEQQAGKQHYPSSSSSSGRNEDRGLASAAWRRSVLSTWV